MTELEKAKQIRTTCKSRMTKFINFLEKISEPEFSQEIDTDEIKSRLKKIEEAWNEFDKAQMVIELLGPYAGSEKERNDFEESYYKATALAEKIIKRNAPSGSSSISFANDAQQNRIAQLEAELSNRRDAKIESLRQIIARTPSETSINVERARLFPLPKLDLPTFS